MPASKLYGPLFSASTPVPAGTLASAPVVSGMIDVSQIYGGEITWRITNSGALAAPCVIMFQISHNGSDWYDYQPVLSKDLLSGTVSQGPSIPLARWAMFIRAIAYGNTTSACSVQAGVQMGLGL